MDYSAFTLEMDRLARQLKTEVYIEPSGVQTPNDANKVIAIWDTGATMTCISKRLASRLSLVSLGFCDNSTANGTRTASSYLVNVFLPNHVVVTDVHVLDMEDGNGGFDVLIGMDIITHGDFSISNYNGKTVFTYRLPSVTVTDYVKQSKVQSIIGPRHGRGNKKRH